MKSAIANALSSECVLGTRGGFATFFAVFILSFARTCANAHAQCRASDAARDESSVDALFERLERGVPAQRDVSLRALESLGRECDGLALVAIDRRRSRLEAELVRAREVALVAPIRDLYRETCRLRVTVCERLRTQRADQRSDAATRADVKRLVDLAQSNADVRVDNSTADALDDHRWCELHLLGCGAGGVELARGSQLPEWMRWSDPGLFRSAGACSLRVASYGETARDFDGLYPSCRVHTVARSLGAAPSPPNADDVRWVTAINRVRALLGTPSVWWCDATSAVLRRRESALRRLIADRRASAQTIVRAVGRFEPSPGATCTLGRVLVLSPKPAETLEALTADDAVLRFCASEDLGDVATLVFDDALIVAESRPARER